MTGSSSNGSFRQLSRRRGGNRHHFFVTFIPPHSIDLPNRLHPPLLRIPNDRSPNPFSSESLPRVLVEVGILTVRPVELSSVLDRYRFLGHHGKEGREGVVGEDVDFIDLIIFKRDEIKVISEGSMDSTAGASELLFLLRLASPTSSAPRKVVRHSQFQGQTISSPS